MRTPLKQVERFSHVPLSPTSGLFLLAQASNRCRRAALATRHAHAGVRTTDLGYGKRRFYWRVLDAARRGVRVRLLVDDLSASGDGVDLRLLASVPGIEVRVFNPFASRGFGPARLLEFIADGERLNRRMHNKAWIADNVGAIIGGRNLGNKYFSGPSETNFADLDVLRWARDARNLT